MEVEQDSTISYYFGKDMEQENADIATYISQIENVTKEQIVKVAQNVTINTIYFLSKQKKQEGKVYERNRKQKF